MQTIYESVLNVNSFYFNNRILIAFFWGITMSYVAQAQGPSSWTKKADVAYSISNAPIARTGGVGFSIGNKGYVGLGSNEDQTKDFWEYNPVDSSWTQKADYNGVSTQNAVGFSIGNKGYVGIGSSGLNLSKEFWEFDPVNNTWTKKADFVGTARSLAVGFSIDNKGYVGTGNDGNDNLKDFWEYNPSNDTWTRKADFGGSARSVAVGFSINNKGYIGVGNSSTDFWEYNPLTDSWGQKTNFPGAARDGAIGFSINGKGYLGMGINKKDFWEYDPVGDSWIQKADFVGPSRFSVVTFVVGNKGYVGMGLEIVLGGNYPNDFWAFDPLANLWKKEPNFGGLTRTGAVGFSIGNKGFIGLGVNKNDIKRKDFWEYNMASNAWTKKQDLTLSTQLQSGSVGFSIENKGYVLMGETVSSFWEYDPTTDTWTQKVGITDGKRINAVGFSIGNKGYVGTGYSNFENKKDFWEYDPAANTWTKKADFGGTARRFATGFSVGNKGYVGLGVSENNLKKDFWEYDPMTDVWTQKTDFGGTARTFGVGFGIGNKGYVGTGYSSSGAQKDFWEYNPATDSWTQKTDFGGSARYAAVGFSIGGRGYIGTGNDANTNTVKDFWEYDPTCYLTAAIKPNTPLSVCSGAPLTLNGSSTRGVSPTYSWSAGGGAFTSNQQNPTFTSPTVTSNTNYTLVLTVSEFGCTATASVGVTVYAPTVGGAVSSEPISCPTAVNLSLSGQVGSVVKWQKSTNASFTNPIDIASTSTILTSATIGTLTTDTYFRAVVKNNVCNEEFSSSALVRVHRKPVITLSTLQQTLNEGNSQTFCDTDANPVNGLQFTVSGTCVVGNPVWRVQVGSNGWSAWSLNPPVSQSSNNQVHRYQAAFDASCPSTYTNPI